MKVYANFNKIKDSARELILCWEDYGFCEIYESPDDNIWLHEIGKICLFDLTIFKNLNQRAKDAELIILGNKDINDELLPNMVHGIFWARHPKSLEEYRQNYGIPLLTERKILSSGIFVYENSIQWERRGFKDWSKYIEFYSLTGKRKYSHIEYLEILSDSRFGLGLCGYGSRCNRETELCGLGTIPIIGDKNYYLDFYNEFNEGEHYILCDNPEDLPEKIHSIQNPTQMSENILNFYENNFSPQGSYWTVCNIIKENL